MKKIEKANQKLLEVVTDLIDIQKERDLIRDELNTLRSKKAFYSKTVYVKLLGKMSLKQKKLDRKIFSEKSKTKKLVGEIKLSLDKELKNEKRL